MISYWARRLVESGRWSEIRLKYVEDPPCAAWTSHSTDVSPEESTDALGVQHCLGAFLIVAIAMVAASVAHCMQQRRWRRQALAVQEVSKKIRQALGGLAAPFSGKAQHPMLLGRLGEASADGQTAGDSERESGQPREAHVKAHAGGILRDEEGLGMGRGKPLTSSV